MTIIKNLLFLLSLESSLIIVFVSTFTRLMIWWSHTRHVQQDKANKPLNMV